MEKALETRLRENETEENENFQQHEHCGAIEFLLACGSWLARARVLYLDNEYFLFIQILF